MQVRNPYTNLPKTALRGLLLAGLVVIAPTLPAGAKPALPRSTTPACPLKCPDGYAVAVYTWELHPERTNYDETGKTQIAPDSLWPITCKLRCEQHAPNQETKEWKDEKLLCSSGRDPGPYTGPWRNSGPFGKECASMTSNGCLMHCYAVPPAKKPRGKAPAKR